MKTIKQIPIKILKALIKASKELLDYYERKIKFLKERCPLCCAMQNFYDSCIDSESCPWLFIEKIHCEKFGYTNLGEHPSYLRDTRKPSWLNLRIPMLKRWIRLMRQEIKRRQKG